MGLSGRRRRRTLSLAAWPRAPACICVAAFSRTRPNSPNIRSSSNGTGLAAGPGLVVGDDSRGGPAEEGPGLVEEGLGLVVACEPSAAFCDEGGVAPRGAGGDLPEGGRW